MDREADESMIKNKALIDRFLRYAAIDTQSSEGTGTVPSTMKQHDLAKVLYEELLEMGASEVVYDRENCVVYAKIPEVPSLENSGEDPYAARGIGFVSHMDTSMACSGADVKPRFLYDYDGTDPLGMLSPEEFPELKRHIGEDLIATDGNTLLGADDKAGVAEIMTMAEYFLTHPEVPHRPVCIAFTSDEEIGCGVDHFDVKQFGAHEAYTVDGSAFGAVEYETFNAAAARITVTGRSIHPGSAKGLMKNASIIAMEYNGLLPEKERPEHTEGREGFYMLMDMHSNCEKAFMKYIIRDHDDRIFEERKKKAAEAAETLNRKYGEGTVKAEITDTYYNMARVLKDHMEPVRTAEKAIRSLGRTPVSEPVRGGTDGSRLTFMGVLCPNLGTGGYNYHSRFEYASVQEMELCAETLIRIAGDSGQ